MQKRIYYSQKCLQHDNGHGHPECPNRLRAIEQYLKSNQQFDDWNWVDSPLVDKSWFEYVHPAKFIERLFSTKTNGEIVYLDDDTAWSDGTGDASLAAAGALKDSVDWMSNSTKKHSMCLSRPPGHHAETNLAMGFCPFAMVACAANYALSLPEIERVTILDFDVHHGNGTEQAVGDLPNVFFASSYQQDNFPDGTTPHNSVSKINFPLTAHCTGDEFLDYWEHTIIPKAAEFNGQLIFVSAGFDAHEADPLADLNIQTENYYSLGKLISKLADQTAQGRVIANLEGGYDLKALSESVGAFLKGLSE